MPTYEYRCANGHVFEVFHRMTDPPPDGCEVCGTGPVERLLSPVAVHFKGSGFYTTDYGRGGRKRDAAGGDGDGGKDAGKADKGPEKAAAAPASGGESATAGSS